jgi:hypothetical protein
LKDDGAYAYIMTINLILDEVYKKIEAIEMPVSVKDLVAKGKTPTKGFGQRGDGRSSKIVDFLKKNAGNGYTLDEVKKGIAFDGKSKQMAGSLHGLKKQGKVEARQMDDSTYWFAKQA